MAWETRGLNRFFYSSRRRGGTVEKTYHGRGLYGEMAAEVIARAKQRRAEQAEALATEKARLTRLVLAMATLDDACRFMLDATLNTGGYHKHDCSWRRRRVRKLKDRSVVEATGRGRDPESA